MDDTLSILRGVQLFRGLEDAVMVRVARSAGRPITFDGRDTIYPDGEAGDRLFILIRPAPGSHQTLSPLVQVDLPSEQGRTVRIERIVAGDYFGETEFLYHGLDPKGGPRITRARAITPARLLPIPFAILSDDPDLLVPRRRILRTGARRLVGALTGQLTARHGDMRLVLANWLIDQATDIGVLEGNRYRFQLKLSQAEIAQEMGVTRETINHWLGTFQRSGLMRTGRQSQSIEILDFERLSHLARLQDGIDRDAHALSVEAVHAAIDDGDLARARNLAADALEAFPASPELAHAMALAAARSGNHADCLKIISAFGLGDGQDIDRLKERVRRGLILPAVALTRLTDLDVVEDHLSADDDWREISETLESRLIPLTEDIAALEARALKEQAFATTISSDRKRHAMASREIYAATHTALGGAYSGINAAAMALFADDGDDAVTRARAIAASLKDPGDYWALATRAEAELLMGNQADAIEWLGKAAAEPEASDGSRASTRLQLARIANHMKIDVAPVLAALPIGSVAVYAGHMFRAAEMGAEQQSMADLDIRGQAVDLFDDHAITRIVGPLACGADIVIAEAALDAGLDLHVVLPLPVDRFIELSVAIGDPEGEDGHWEARFRSVLERASRLSIPHHGVAPDRDLDGVFFHGFRHAAGRALMLADILETGCRLLAVHDTKRANNIAGTSQAVADWAETGHPIDLIAFPFEREAPAGRARGANAFKPVVFVWPENGNRTDIEDAVGKLAQAHPIVPRKAPGKREGLAVILESPDQAIHVGTSILTTLGDRTPCRVIADFGLVLKDRGKPDDEAIAKLVGGSDIIGAPADRIVATPAFAAEARFVLGNRLHLHALGRFDSAGDDQILALASQELFAVTCGTNSQSTLI